jgi:spore maturation protein CgeB
MRIAFVGVDAPGALAHALAAGAREAGHEGVVVAAPELVSGRRALFLARRAGAEQPVAWPYVTRLARRLREADPELVVVVKGRFLTARAVRRLRHTIGRPLLNYYPDHPLWPGHDDPQVLAALHEYDQVLVWGDHVAEALASRGVRDVRVVRFGYDPAIYRPPPGPIAERWDVAMVGQCYPGRARFVQALAGPRSLVTGLGWPRVVPGAGATGLPADETCRAYWESRVAVNILAPWNVPSHNMRTFEIPAAGSVMLATRTPVHEELFGDDAALLVDTPEEAREAVAELLRDDGRARRIAAAGRRAVEGCTYAHRIGEIVAGAPR